MEQQDYIKNQIDALAKIISGLIEYLTRSGSHDEIRIKNLNETLKDKLDIRRALLSSPKINV